MPNITLLILAGAIMAAPASAQTPIPAPSPADSLEAIEGVWSNPSGHVHVEIAPCNPHFCGTVVFATDKARADAAKAGTIELIGTSLFHEFQPDPNGGWDGKVLVPDLKKSVSGRIRVIDANTLDVQGCMFGHLACKDQKWTRVD